MIAHLVYTILLMTLLYSTAWAQGYSALDQFDFDPSLALESSLAPQTPSAGQCLVEKKRLFCKTNFGITVNIILNNDQSQKNCLLVQYYLPKLYEPPSSSSALKTLALKTFPTAHFINSEFNDSIIHCQQTPTIKNATELLDANPTLNFSTQSPQQPTFFKDLQTVFSYIEQPILSHIFNSKPNESFNSFRINKEQLYVSLLLSSPLWDNISNQQTQLTFLDKIDALITKEHELYQQPIVPLYQKTQLPNFFALPPKDNNHFSLLHIQSLNYNSSNSLLATLCPRMAFGAQTPATIEIPNIGYSSILLPNLFINYTYLTSQHTVKETQAFSFLMKQLDFSLSDSLIEFYLNEYSQIFDKIIENNFYLIQSIQSDIALGLPYDSIYTKRDTVQKYQQNLDKIRKECKNFFETKPIFIIQPLKPKN